MANYDMIKGYIEDIYEGSTSTGKEYLGIKFFYNEEHQNASFPEIRLWFSSPKAKEFSQEKIERLFQFAGLEYDGAKPSTVKAALKALAREEFVALEFNVTVQPETYEGKTRAKYDIGWDNNASLGMVESGLNQFASLLEERMKGIKGTAPKPAQGSSLTPEDLDVDCPF